MAEASLKTLVKLTRVTLEQQNALEALLADNDRERAAECLAKSSRALRELMDLLDEEMMVYAGSR